MSLARIWVLVCLVALLGACGGSGGGTDPTLQLLNENMAKWDAAQLSDYRYTYDKSCFCGPGETDEMEIVVVNGEINSATTTSDNALVDPVLFGALHTVDDLFELIRSAVNSGAARLSVSYDANLGYPSVIDVDYDTDAVDDEITIRIADVAPL